MKADLHVHSREGSPCGQAGEEEMIRAAMAAGLDGLCFTDHHRLAPYERLEELRRRYAPFRVFGGVEVGVEGEDVLVYGCSDPDLELEGWTWPELWKLVRSYDAFAAVAHPFRFRPRILIDILTYPPDALEVHSLTIGPNAEERIRHIAGERGLLLLANSDAHRTEVVGTYYNDLDGNPANERELIELLRRGRYTCEVNSESPAARPD
jgi:hypothetical protein